MAVLHIDFQDGFTGDTVAIQIDGKEVLRQENLKTKRVLGRAGSSKIEVPEGSINVEINVPSKNIVHTIPLQIAGETYLGVSIQKDKLDYVVSKKPFGYG